ncbi:MAG: hypothetical protein ACYS0I_20130 [Planctomycetota bacterium]
MDNTLCCGYDSDAGCLALLAATFGGPAAGRIQQGEVSACPGYDMVNGSDHVSRFMI